MSAPLQHKHFQDLLDRFSELDILISRVRSTFESERHQLTKLKQAIAQNEPESAHMVSMHNSFFQKMLGGEFIFYDQSQQTVDQLLTNLDLRCNKQFSWILAEAFEAFEKYIATEAAYIGSKNHKAWNSTKPNKTEVEVDQKDFSWFLEKSQKIKGLNGKLKIIKSAYPALETYESQNYFDVDFNFILTAIEKMRHSIVHNSGEMNDHKAFIRKIFEATGKSNNGNYDKKNLSLIDRFIGFHDDRCFILLLDEYGTKTIDTLSYPFSSRIEPLLKWLLAYADVINTDLLHRI